MGFDPNEPRDGRGRWSRMNSTQKAQLTSRAQFSGTSQSKGALRGRAMGEGGRAKPGKVWSDERIQSHFRTDTSKMVEKKNKSGRFEAVGKGPKVARDAPVDMAFWAKHESPAAIAIQTAKALDRDFRAARDKANIEAMKAAIHKSNVPIVKYPSKKPKR